MDPPGRPGSVGPGGPGLADGGLATLPARPGDAFAAERDVAQRGLRFGLDSRFAVGAAAPAGDHETGTTLHHRLEFVVGLDARGVLVAILDRAGEQPRLDLL